MARERRMVLIVFAMCVAPRVAAARAPYSDPDNNTYLEIASSLLARHAFALDGATTTYLER